MPKKVGETSSLDINEYFSQYFSIYTKDSAGHLTKFVHPNNLDFEDSITNIAEKPK